jgi:hypothetical protein
VERENSLRNENDIQYNGKEPMPQLRQYITFVFHKNSQDKCIIATSQQHSKEMAERQVLMDLEDMGGSNKVFTRELVIDEDGVIRLVDDEGEVLEKDIHKI